MLLAFTAPARCDLLGDLFGMRPPAPEAPALTITRGRRAAAPARRKPSRSRAEGGATVPKLQRTRDILDDDTLREGDALMAKDGIRIYAGGRSAPHTAAQFIPLGAARHIGPQARVLLLAINDARRRHPSSAIPHAAAAPSVGAGKAAAGP